MSQGQDNAGRLSSDSQVGVKQANPGKFGIARDFLVAGTSASLSPTVTSGEVFTPYGMLVVRDAQFGNATGTDVTMYALNVLTGAVYNNVTGTLTNPEDIVLGYADATTTITRWRVGQWANAQNILIAQAAAVTGSANTELANYMYMGPPGYIYALTGTVTTTTTGSGTVTYTLLDAAADTVTAIGTLTIGAVTKDLNNVVGVVSNHSITPIAINPGDMILADTGVAACAGVVDLYCAIGGIRATS